MTCPGCKMKLMRVTDETGLTVHIYDKGKAFPCGDISDLDDFKAFKSILIWGLAGLLLWVLAITACLNP